MSATETETWQTRHSPEGIEEERPYVIVIAYGNNGETFTEVVQQDRNVEQFNEGIRERFDEAVHGALEIEQRYR